jgi:hypothetical protein
MDDADTEGVQTQRGVSTPATKGRAAKSAREADTISKDKPSRKKR